MKKIRTHFISGILIVAPLALSLYVAWIVIGIADNIFRPLLPLHKFGLPRNIPGAGLLVAFVVFTLIGAVAGGFIGRFYHRVVEGIFTRIPGINTIYSTIKQIIDTFATTKSNAFKEVVLIEYPLKGTYALGFLTAETTGEVSKVISGKMINVFMPSTPNPTTGFLMFIPLKNVKRLDMTVDQAIKFIISAGMITPHHPVIKKALPKNIKKKSSSKK